MKLNSKVTRGALIASLLFGAWTLIGAQDQSGQSNASQPADTQPDNTKINQRDRNSNEATADQQKANRSDRDITQQVRKAIIADKSLSTYAHNIKIVTVNGSVTLNGVVRSEDEKGAVEMKATNIAGKNNVTNYLKVAPSK